jgi:hypothetical protein
MNIVKVTDKDGIVHMMSLRTWIAYCGKAMAGSVQIENTSQPLSCIACIIKPSQSTASS